MKQKRKRKKEQGPKFKTLQIEETKYRTLYTEKFVNRKKWITPDEKKIYSFLPGTINKIFIKKGQTVRSGSKMLILEAMKMKNTLQVPTGGTIKNIHVEEGQKVAKGELLVELE